MVQCSAKSKSSGSRCRKAAIAGGAVCRFHGGLAGQVQASARRRLAGLVDPAISQLEKLLKSRHAPTAMAAVRDVLDRNGYKVSEKLELSGAAGGPMAHIQVIFVDPADTRRAEVDTKPQEAIEVECRQIAPPDGSVD